MIPKPQLQDLKNIGYYLGKIIIGIGLTMLVPMVIGLLIRGDKSCLGFSNRHRDYLDYRLNFDQIMLYRKRPELDARDDCGFAFLAGSDAGGGDTVISERALEDLIWMPALTRCRDLQQQA